MNKSKLVSVCSTTGQQDAFFLGQICKPFLLYKGSSKSEMMQVQVSIPSFPENLLYYEHYKTESCLSSNRLSVIVVGGDDNGQVNKGYFTRYDQVFSVDFSHHLRSVAAAFHVVSQLASCEDVQFHLGESNIELSSTDNRLSTKGTTNNKALASTTVKYLKIRADATIEEEKWEAGLTRVDEILKYAKAHWPNLQVVNIQLRCPTVATRAKYVGAIDEFLGLDSDLLPNLVAHRTCVQGGVVRCQPKADDEEIIIVEQRNPFRRLQESQENFFEKAAGVRPPPFLAFEEDTHHHGAFGTFAPFPVPPPAPLLQQSSSSSSQSTPNHVETAPTNKMMRIKSKRKNHEPNNRTLANNQGNNLKTGKGDDDDNVGAGADQDNNHEDETSELPLPPKNRTSTTEIPNSQFQQFPRSHSPTPPSNLTSSSTSSSCQSAFRSGPSLSHNSSPVDNHNHSHIMPPESYCSSSSASSFPPLKGSSFEDWENSSGDDEEQESRSPPPRHLLCTTSSAYLNPPFIDLNALKHISFDKEQITNIINTVNGNAIEKKKKKEQQQQQQQRSTKPPSSYRPLVEGVHYDRRRPKKIKRNEK